MCRNWDWCATALYATNTQSLLARLVAVMRATAVRLVRIIPRKALDPAAARVVNAPAPQTNDLKQPTVLDLLLQQREKAGADWPANIRIEPVVRKEAYKPVQAEVRTQLKKLLKER